VIGTLKDAAAVCYVNINRTKSGTDSTGTFRIPNDEHGVFIGYGKDINICECTINYNRTHGVFGPRMKRVILKDSDVSFNEVDGLNYVPDACVLGAAAQTRSATLSTLININESCSCNLLGCICYYFDACGNRICCG